MSSKHCRVTCWGGRVSEFDAKVEWTAWNSEDLGSFRTVGSNTCNV